MQNIQKNIASLIGSRICHDLISPLGAISNGIELLSMREDMDCPEIALINESVLNANARIRFFRISFGLASDDQIVSKAEILSILEDISHTSRIKVVWSIPNDVPRSHVKLAFLLLQCLETSMPYGGTITVDMTVDRWIIHAISERMKSINEMWQLLISPNIKESVSPSDVHFLLAPDAARQAGKKLCIDIKESEIILTF